jgi:hypothetical protein
LAMRILLFLFFFSPVCAMAQNKIRFDTAAIVSDSVFQWKVLDDRAGVVYYLQQYRWNTWKDMDSAVSKAGSYALSMARFVHHGENKFRVRAAAPGMLVYSKILKLHSEKPKANAIAESFSKKKTASIDLGLAHYYELYDAHGVLLSKGFGQSVNIQDLDEGSYYLNYAEISSMFRLTR